MSPRPKRPRCWNSDLELQGSPNLLAQTDTIALHVAAGNGHVAATRALLESGVAIDKPNSRRQTALHVAAESGHTAVIEALIEHGAHHFYDVIYETPIHLAAKAGHINVLEFCRRAGLTNSNSFNTMCSRATRRSDPSLAGLR